MSGFWDLSDGNTADGNGGSYEVPTGGGVIPNDSSVLAAPDEAKWEKDQSGNEFVMLRWSVIKPEDLTGRKVFHKLWVTDDEPRAKDPKKKRDKALNMLRAIDANAGGKLARLTRKPTSDDLALCLIGRPMVIKVMVYDMQNADGSRNVGNWIAAVNAKGHELKIGTEAPPQKMATKQSGGGMGARDDVRDDEIPF